MSKDSEIIASLIKSLEGEVKALDEQVPKGESSETLMNPEQVRIMGNRKEEQEDLKAIISHIESGKPYEYAMYENDTLSIREKIVNENEALKNRDLAQNIDLKKKTLNMLLKFLGAETALIFFYAWCQATVWWGFSLEEWSFRLLVGATIIQITTMLQIAVKHLFPNGH